MLINFIKLGGWQLSGVSTGWMKVFWGGNFLGGNYSGENLQVVIFCVGDFLGGSCPGGNFLGGSFTRWKLSGWEFSWVEIFRVVIFQVGVFLGGNCPDGTYPGCELSLVEVFQVGIVQWESSRWQFFGWLFSCYRFLYNTYKHIQAQIWKTFKHMLTMLSSLYLFQNCKNILHYQQCSFCSLQCSW